MNINAELVQWCQDQFGENKPFRSARQWALKSGLNAHAVNTILESGKISARAAIALARTAKQSPMEPLRLGGFLMDADIPGEITSEESDLLATFRQLRPYDQTHLRNIARALLGTDDVRGENGDTESAHPSESLPL